MSKTELIEWIFRWAILAFSLIAAGYLIGAWPGKKPWQTRSWFISFALVIAMILVHAAGMIFGWISYH